MHIALPAIMVVKVGAAITLHTARDAAKQANCSITRHRVASGASQGLILLAEEIVEDEREARKSVDCRVVQYDPAVELRGGVRMAVMSAPAGQRVLQGVLVGEVGEGRDAKHGQEAIVFAGVARKGWGRREGGGKDGST